MKKLLVCLMALLMCALCACASDTRNTSEPAAESKEIEPTGYPNGQVQRACLFYNGKLYIDAGFSKGTTDAEPVGTIRVEDNYHIPCENFMAAHLKVGSNVYEVGDIVYVYAEDLGRFRAFEACTAEELNFYGVVSTA